MRAIAAGNQIAQRDRKIAEHLVTLGVLAVEEPQQFVLPKPDFIWLPNEFVTGAENENPPLELLRQTQDVMALRLAIELYHAQNLRDDGGVARSVTWYEYERFKVGQQGQFTIWGFRQRRLWLSCNDTTEPHLRRNRGKRSGVDFFARMESLATTGLIEWVPHLRMTRNSSFWLDRSTRL
jgi:hypothetical protein